MVLTEEENVLIQVDGPVRPKDIGNRGEGKSEKGKKSGQKTGA